MSSPESDAARVQAMTVELALEIADLGNNALYRRGWYDPAHARDAALDVLAKEVRRLWADHEDSSTGAEEWIPRAPRLYTRAARRGSCGRAARIPLSEDDA